VGGLTRAELLDALDPDGAPQASDAVAAPTLDELLVYVDAAELDGVPAEVAGIVFAAREMGAAFLATRGGRQP
jgi:hypothetical protein